jgi:gliding motility-associated-like protein
MKCNTTIFKSFFRFVSIVLILISTRFSYGQTISPQVKDSFFSICATSETYSVSLDFTYKGFSGTPNFVLELSDLSGNFVTTTALIINSFNDQTVGLETMRTVNFSIPPTLVGSEYKIRVRETNSNRTANYKFKTGTGSPNVDKIPIYYLSFQNSFFINNKQETATICSNGGSTILSIDNIKGSTPLDFPNLKYKWYKIGTPIDIEKGTGSSLVVKEAGDFYVNIDYGACTQNNFTSNRVKVNVNGGGSSGTIIPSPEPKICAENGLTTLTPSISGNSYKWFFNQTEIKGETNKEYKTNISGEYSVVIDFGGCSGTLSLVLEAYGIQASINAPTIEVGKTATVTTSDTNVKYEWFFNDILIPNETSNTYIPIVKGKYKVAVTQATGCKATKEIPFTAIDFADIQLIPNLISPNNDGINDTWIIPQEYLTGSNAEIVIYSAQGQVVLQTNNYQNNFPTDPIDFASINPVYYYTITTKDQGVKKGSITVVK